VISDRFFEPTPLTDKGDRLDLVCTALREWS